MDALRLWLLRLLVGRSPIAMNIGVVGMLVIPKGARGGYIDAEIDGNPAALRDLADVGGVGVRFLT